MKIATLTLCLIVTGLPAWADPFRIAVISDLNGSYGSTDYGDAVHGAVASIIARRPDLVISTGDMIAGQRADPKLTAPELAEMWQAFHAAVSDPLSTAEIPLLVTPGNHDASAYPGYEGDRVAYAQAWEGRVPKVPLLDARGWPRHVAVEMDGVMLIGVDATISGPLDEAERAWLSGVLAGADPSQTIVLFGHLPMMPISQGREDDVLDDPALFDAARAAGVDLWLSGHHHAFYSGLAGGILFVSQAALGSGPRRLIGQAERSPAAYTWIEIAEDGAVSVSAMQGPEFVAEVNPESLPSTLGQGPFALTRAFHRAP